MTPREQSCRRCDFLNACGLLLACFVVVVIVAIAIFTPDVVALRGAP